MDQSPLLDALDRQEAMLPDDSRELLLAVGPLLARLEDEPSVRTVFAALRSEAAELDGDLRKLDEESIRRLTWNAEDYEHVLGGGSEAATVRGDLAGVKVGRDHYLPLLAIAPRPGPAQAAIDALEDIAERHRAQRSSKWLSLIPAVNRALETSRDVVHRRRAIVGRALSDPAVALVRLDVVRDLVNPPPNRYEEAMEGRRYPVQLDIEPRVSDYVYGEAEERGAHAGVVEPIAFRAREDVRRVLAEVRRRLAVGRSRREVIERFRSWAQWYARDHLRELIDETPSDPLGRRRIEEALTDRMAEWLFDHGLDPLWEPLFGRVKPDLLDPSEKGRLFVEAKRSDDGAGVRDAAAQGVRQALDTADELSGTVHRLDEAFVVVFQLDGPRAELPDTVEFTQLRVHPVVVDLTPWQKVASNRAKNPIVIGLDDLRTTIEATPSERDG